jgi:hypothetical protein
MRLEKRVVTYSNVLHHSSRHAEKNFSVLCRIFGNLNEILPRILHNAYLHSVTEVWGI